MKEITLSGADYEELLKGHKLYPDRKNKLKAKVGDLIRVVELGRGRHRQSLHRVLSVKKIENRTLKNADTEFDVISIDPACFIRIWFS